MLVRWTIPVFITANPDEPLGLEDDARRIGERWLVLKAPAEDTAAPEPSISVFAKPAIVDLSE